MSKVKISEFITQVRQEIQKVTWPSRKETGSSTVMILIMILIASVFFLVVDLVVFNVLQLILGIGG